MNPNSAFALGTAAVLAIVTLASSVPVNAQERAPTGRSIPRSEQDSAESWLAGEFRKYRTYARLDRAYRLIEQGRLQAARGELEQTIAIDRVNLRVRSAYLSLLHRLGDHGGVIAQSRAVLGQHPGFVPAMLYAGMAQQAIGRGHDALISFRGAADAPGGDRGDRLFALQSMAEIAGALGNDRDVLWALERLAADTPTFAVHQKRGRLLERLERWEAAEAAFATAAASAQRPADKLEATRAAGFAALRNGHLQAARRHLAAAAEIDPNAYPVVRALGQLAHQQRDYAAAATWLQQAVALRGDLADRRLRVDALRQLGAHDEASTPAVRVTGREGRQPAQLYASMAAGWQWLRAQRLDEAAHSFERALRIAGGDHDQAARALAYTLQRMGRPRDAVPYMERVALRAADRETYVRLATLLHEAGEGNGAVQWLRQADAVERDPAVRSDVQRQLGFLLYELGRHDEADEAFRAALAHGGDNGVVLAALAEVALKREQPDRAIDLLTRALRVEQDASARHRLAAALAAAGAAEQALGAYSELAMAAPPRGWTCPSCGSRSADCTCASVICGVAPTPTRA